MQVPTTQNALLIWLIMACFNFIIIDFVPCHPTIILSGNVWQQESFQDPSVSSNSGGSIKSCKINMSCRSIWFEFFEIAAEGGRVL